jgi:hypothetical protein
MSPTIPHEEGWDPTEPTLPELMEDWDAWAKMLGAEHALDRLVMVCLGLREKYDAVFQIRPGSFMKGVKRVWDEAPDFVFKNAHDMSRVFNVWFSPGVSTKLNHQGLGICCSREGRHSLGVRYHLGVPAPGYDAMGLPRLNIHGTEAYVILDGTRQDWAKINDVEVKVFTAQQVAQDATICPLCQNDFEYWERAEFPNQERLVRTELDRWIDSPHHLSGTCRVKRGDMVMASMVEFKLYHPDGTPWPMTGIDDARQAIRAWCARTPGLVYLPSTHGQKYMVGSVEPITGEVLALLRVHALLGRVSDDEVVRAVVNDPVLAQEARGGRTKMTDKITLATVKRWRKSLDLPEVKP